MNDVLFVIGNGLITALGGDGSVLMHNGDGSVFIHNEELDIWWLDVGGFRVVYQLIGTVGRSSSFLSVNIMSDFKMKLLAYDIYISNMSLIMCFSTDEYRVNVVKYSLCDPDIIDKMVRRLRRTRRIWLILRKLYYR